MSHLGCHAYTAKKYNTNHNIRFGPHFPPLFALSVSTRTKALLVLQSLLIRAKSFHFCLPLSRRLIWKTKRNVKNFFLCLSDSHLLCVSSYGIRVSQSRHLSTHQILISERTKNKRHWIGFSLILGTHSIHSIHSKLLFVHFLWLFSSLFSLFALLFCALILQMQWN